MKFPKIVTESATVLACVFVFSLSWFTVQGLTPRTEQRSQENVLGESAEDHKVEIIASKEQNEIIRSFELSTQDGNNHSCTINLDTLDKTTYTIDFVTLKHSGYKPSTVVIYPVANDVSMEIALKTKGIELPMITRQGNTPAQIILGNHEVQNLQLVVKPEQKINYGSELKFSIVVK